MTALSTVSPSFASASVFSFCRIIALISGGLYCLPRASTRTSPLGPASTLYGTIVSSSLTSASLRPMKRLIEKIVCSGFMTACHLVVGVAGGIAIGFVISWSVIWVLQRLDDIPLGILMSVLMGYASFAVAEAVGASG